MTYEELVENVISKSVMMDMIIPLWMKIIVR